MKGKSYRNILLLIIATGLLLTGTQVYFTIQNYNVNKQRFINDVQIALDLSIEKYFADRARSNFYVLRMDRRDTLMEDDQSERSLNALDHMDSILNGIQTNVKIDIGNGTHDTSMLKVVVSQTSTLIDTLPIDSLLKSSTTIQTLANMDEKDAQLTSQFEALTQKVMLSVSEELVDIEELFTLVRQELDRKNLSIDFRLREQTMNGSSSIGELSSNSLSTRAKSSYLGAGHSLDMDFENATLSILKRGISDLILSFLLVGWVMGAMIHLYRTINKQKQLAEIKDDLISNITHEFKTPIATISSALEGITNFNEENDPDKTKRYLAVSNDQLDRLNGMVEKLLETAALDKGGLELNLEEIELVQWTKEIIDRFHEISQGKTIEFESQLSSSFQLIDRFHLENALANLLDNAIKYGGSEIMVRLFDGNPGAVWEVEDTGGNIPHSDKEQIFEKLYRIPTGNQHDVKGFGIGLFYARSIAELHHGELVLEIGKGKTLFRLSL